MLPTGIDGSFSDHCDGFLISLAFNQHSTPLTLYSGYCVLVLAVLEFVHH